MRTTSHEQYCDLVEREIAQLVEVSRTAEPTAPVPGCGTWRTRTLLHHVGQIHDWVTRIVSTGSRKRLPRTAEAYPIPADPARWPAWLEAGGAALLSALRGADPDAPVWVWGPDAHVRWWARRMLHETGVHRVDAERAQDLTPAVAPDVAADGVAEFLTNLPSAERWAWDVRKLRGTGETIALAATDHPAAWRITLEPERFRWEPATADGPAATAAVRGEVVDLYLFMWGRWKVGEASLRSTGDTGLVGRWVTNSAI